MASFISRRDFLKAASSVLALPALSGVVRGSQSPDGIPHGPHSITEGAKIVDACIDAGINYIDCASSYGNAEVKVGEVMKTRRKDVILTTKTLERDKDDAWKEINRSLERLKTDYVDLLQIHSINSMDQLDAVTGKNGSLASAVRAKEQGMCKHVGITGHTRPMVIREALNRYPFETTLVPLSSVDKLVNDFGDVLFPLAKDKTFGIIAMKVLSAGRVTEYVSESLRYAMTLPISTAIVGMDTLKEVNQNVEVAKSFKPMTDAEMKSLVEKTRLYASTSILWWKRT
ncbi:MAG: Aldo ket red domain-containing protein [Bacteroidetes bacterium]|nr:Aldo ket red domain-containing protein [Bacteroidota bacterium]